MAALAPADMAISNAVANRTGLSTAHDAYSMPLTMPVEILVAVSQSPPAKAFAANWEQIAKKVDQQLIHA